MKIGYAVLFVSALCVVSAESENAGILRVPLTRRTKTNGLQKRDANIYNDGGSIYLINVAIGTPAQNFELVLDTGSADLWVPGSQCAANICPLAKFGETKSSTFNVTTQPFNITYGIGDANGVYATDTVTIAGATVQQQKFGYVTNTKNILTEMKTLNGQTYTPTVSSADNATTYANDYRMDGIFGLGYPFITAPVDNLYTPFFFNLKAQNKISQNVFSIFLNSSEAYGNSGEIIFGGTDATKFRGDLTYLPVVKTTRKSINTGASKSDYGYWQVYGQGVGVLNGVGGKNTDLGFQDTTTFVFDTGTTLSYLPANILQPLIAASVGNNNVAFDSKNNYFQIRCGLAKQNITIQYMMSTTEQVSNSPVVLNIPLADLIFPMDTDYVETASVCMLGIVPTTGTIFLGESILRSIYQAYDADQNRIGIAAAVTSDSSISVNGTVNGGTKGSNAGNTNNNGTSTNRGSSGSTTVKNTLFLSIIAVIFSLSLSF